MHFNNINVNRRQYEYSSFETRNK